MTRPDDAPELPPIGASSEGTPLERELSSAIDHGEVFFAHQPQVDLHDGRLVGVEALIRWQHPERGLLMPGAFLPGLGDVALLDRITHFAIESAIAQWRSWAAEGVRLPIAVNVTPLILSNEEFPAWVTASLDTASIPAGMLKLELTEETLIADGERAAEVIEALGARGVEFSVDDFGAGYSSLSHLLGLDVHEVKIDRCFVEAMPTNRRARRIVGALAGLCRELGITVVAEGVSSAEIVAALEETGCSVGQGYYLGRPMSASQVASLVAAFETGASAFGAERDPRTSMDRSSEPTDPRRSRGARRRRPM